MQARQQEGGREGGREERKEGRKEGLELMDSNDPFKFKQGSTTDGG